MSRLIDADKLKNHYAWWDNEDKKIFDDIVDLQPTAFDVEKVVAEIKELSFEWLGDIRTCDVIKILRKGGIDG